MKYKSSAIAVLAAGAALGLWALPAHAQSTGRQAGRMSGMCQNGSSSSSGSTAATSTAAVQTTSSLAGSIAANSRFAQASVNRFAASLSGEPGAPAFAPKTKATKAITASGSMRVTRRRRRSTSGVRGLISTKLLEAPARFPCFHFG